MKALRLLPSFKNPSPSLFSRWPTAVFSSSAAANPRFSNSSASASDDDEQGGGVYRHVLKFQRPTTIKWYPWWRWPNLGNFRNFYDAVIHPSLVAESGDPNLGNSSSFIGTVTHPPRVINNENGGPFGVHTLLSVQNSPQSHSDFRVLLIMLEETAELCLKHLKPNDFIYVSGPLGSYTKADQNGNSRLYYKLVVKELNYVAQHGKGSSSKNYEELQYDGGDAYSEKYRDRLHLWQVFFINPYEWWDNRKEKKNPKQPYFKHKDTGEALWLKSDDPPWVKRQLQLLDTKMAEQGHGQKRFRVSKWEYDE